MTNRVNYAHSTGTTGRLFELDHLYPLNDPRIRMLEKIDTSRIKYRTLAQAILETLERNVGGYRGTELWDPPSPWLNSLHYEIVSELHDSEWQHLTVMPTLYTAADIYHGIDFLVIYEEPETEREVILSADLTLRGDKEFKSDVLVTNIGAIPNHTYYYCDAREVRDVEYSTKQEDAKIQQKRIHAIGNVIANIIQEKLLAEDPHYGRSIAPINRRIYYDIQRLHQMHAA